MSFRIWNPGKIAMQPQKRGKWPFLVDAMLYYCRVGMWCIEYGQWSFDRVTHDGGAVPVSTSSSSWRFCLLKTTHESDDDDERWHNLLHSIYDLCFHERMKM